MSKLGENVWAQQLKLLTITHKQFHAKNNNFLSLASFWLFRSSGISKLVLAFIFWIIWGMLKKFRSYLYFTECIIINGKENICRNQKRKKRVQALLRRYQGCPYRYQEEKASCAQIRMRHWRWQLSHCREQLSKPHDIMIIIIFFILNLLLSIPFSLFLKNLPPITGVTFYSSLLACCLLAAKAEFSLRNICIFPFFHPFLL